MPLCMMNKSIVYSFEHYSISIPFQGCCHLRCKFTTVTMIARPWPILILRRRVEATRSLGLGLLVLCVPELL